MAPQHLLYSSLADRHCDLNNDCFSLIWQCPWKQSKLHSLILAFFTDDKAVSFSNGTACFKFVNNCLITSIYSYLETSGCQSSNLFLNFVHIFNTVLISHLWPLKTVFFPALVSYTFCSVQISP
jgi:hypothetical protein